MHRFDKLEEISDKKSISAYIGFDCTAPSLHVGSLLQIMILRLMQKHGHNRLVFWGWNYINWRPIRKRLD